MWPQHSIGEGDRMTFWQENYSFIKEVYDTRYFILSMSRKNKFSIY